MSAAVPPVNIPPRIRFGLYVTGAVASPTVAYAIARGWAGEPELVLVTALAGLLNLLAAAKTPLHDEPSRPLA